MNKDLTLAEFGQWFLAQSQDLRIGIVLIHELLCQAGVPPKDAALTLHALIERVRAEHFGSHFDGPVN
jgi:hypothetical protein